MDLSTLNQSLKEEESSSQRRSTHLRAAEDELNAFFRSSALGLTTLYRQGVAASKVSYEKGYAHALAHVLELWDKDRGWLKGYLQRRIEAIEASVDVSVFFGIIIIQIQHTASISTIIIHRQYQSS
uniref:Uncharacterized protein n=1 Tax=Melanopsichium pennsylvanicum 4 TaxID=1398559 RepID=A0A077R574_9BASI|nr:conserved hypothetical protein [Melanopsichium pennsylvanicum 4]